MQIIREAGFEDVRVASPVEYDYPKGDGYGVMSVTVEGVKR